MRIVGRQENVIRRQIEEGITEYLTEQRIERCGTITQWTGPLPRAITVNGPCVHLADGSYHPITFN